MPGKAIEPYTRTHTHTHAASPTLVPRPLPGPASLSLLPAVQIEDGKSIYGILSLAEPTICLAMTTTETMPQQQQQLQQQDDTNHREMPQRRPEQTEIEAE